MNPQLKQAFLAARDGYSADRVVADPPLNKRFLEACRRLGLGEPPVELNMQLLNARKASGLSNVPTTRRTAFRDADGYLFASEIAARFLERRDATTLDRVLCKPGLAAEFDHLASRIAPGYTPLQYRWAALALRKRKRLTPEPISYVLRPTAVVTALVAELVVSIIPVQQGLYLFFDSERALYIGETENLRRRIAKHLEHSDNRGLARWLWEFGEESLHLEYHVLPATAKRRERKALEIELIRSRRPVFNVLGT